MRKSTENYKKLLNKIDKEKSKNGNDEDEFSSVDLSEEQDNLHELPDSNPSISPQRQNIANPVGQFSAIK